jgi:hypothetical protein
MDERVTWDDYYASANSAPELTERERIFIGLAVTLTKTCEP